MCGIVGYIGTKKAVPVLIKGLLSLEYRGYDSAGICILENNTLNVIKDKGRVKNLENNPYINNLVGNIGIAHTRWATHGIPSKENSHPHLDNSKTFAVVHNGIIINKWFLWGIRLVFFYSHTHVPSLFLFSFVCLCFL